MKILTLAFVAVTGFAVGLNFQDKHQEKKAAPPAMAMQMPKPGPEHALLKKSCGEWDCVVHSQGQTSKATATTRAHGEFFTIDDFHGEFGGMAFVGHGINGYDPNKKQFFSVWTDSMSPSPTFEWGTYDEKKKELKMIGDTVGMDGKPCKMTSVTTFKDDDHMEFAMTMPGADGKDEQMKIEYTRKKK